MEAFRITRGSVKGMGANGSMNIQPSIVAVDGISSAGDTILVSNFQVTDNEKLGVVQCFNDTNHLYAFGHDPESSGFSVTYIVFMGGECMKDGFEAGDSTRLMVQAYNEMKVSQHGLMHVTFGKGVTLTGVVCSLDVGVFDPDLNALTVTVAGKALRWD